MTDQDSDISMKTIVLQQDVPDDQLKAQFIATARQFLDDYEKDSVHQMRSAAIFVSGFNQVDLPSGLTPSQRKVLEKDNEDLVSLKGATIGSYPKLIESIVQSGLGLAPQALLHHQRSECSDPHCDLNEDTQVAIPAIDLIIDTANVVISSGNITAAGMIMRTMSDALPKLRNAYIDRLRVEDPAAFAKAIEKANIPEELREAIISNDTIKIKELTASMGPGAAGSMHVITGKHMLPVLKAALDSGAVPDDEKERIQGIITRIEAEGEKTKPENMSEHATFVSGDKSRKH